jgi:predicted DNA repair protein MutK
MNNFVKIMLIAVGAFLLFKNKDKVIEMLKPKKENQPTTTQTQPTNKD